MLIIGLVLTMLCCIILGMGVPTTANYCIMASTCAPILMALGIPQVAAHFFVFYFGIVADITPPVALAAYAGSAIAKATPMKTAVNASKIAISAFIVPYIFAYFPALILEGGVPIYWTIFNAACGMGGLFCVAASFNGYLMGKINPLLRLLAFVGGVCFMVPLTGFTEMVPLVMNVVGIAAIVILIVCQKIFGNRGDAGGSDDSNSGHAGGKVVPA